MLKIMYRSLDTDELFTYQEALDEINSRDKEEFYLWLLDNYSIDEIWNMSESRKKVVYEYEYKHLGAWEDKYQEIEVEEDD